jgi:hypothetical protein
MIANCKDLTAVEKKKIPPLQSKVISSNEKIHLKLFQNLKRAIKSRAQTGKATKALKTKTNQLTKSQKHIKLRSSKT